MTGDLGEAEPSTLDRDPAAHTGEGLDLVPHPAALVSALLLLHPLRELILQAFFLFNKPNIVKPAQKVQKVPAAPPL